MFIRKEDFRIKSCSYTYQELQVCFMTYNCCKPTTQLDIPLKASSSFSIVVPGLKPITKDIIIRRTILFERINLQKLWILSTPTLYLRQNITRRTNSMNSMTCTCIYHPDVFCGRKARANEVVEGINTSFWNFFYCIW